MFLIRLLSSMITDVFLFTFKKLERLVSLTFGIHYDIIILVLKFWRKNDTDT